ncbi:MAG: hypothetical protein MUF31_04470 [Akkermansiaceae bacterium]|jgi:rhamnosyltransferase subunit B|nr:hypothetical protein [Akkermansiaceae bacterium]
MHFVFATSGSFGDLGPLIVMAMGLREKGHECVFVANEYHRASVEKWGFPFEGAGDRERYLALFNDPRLASRLKNLPFLLRESVGDFRPIYDGILRVARADSLIVYRCAALGATAAAEKLGLRSVSVVITPIEMCPIEHPPTTSSGLANFLMHRTPMWITRRTTPIAEHLATLYHILPGLNRLRKEVGLPPIRRGIRDEVRKSSAIMLLFPEWFMPRESYWRENTRHSGFMFLPDTGEVDPGVEAFLASGSPPVAISAGSAVRADDGFVPRMIAAARAHGERVLVLDFSHDGPAKVDGAICVTRPQPVGKVLPHCAAVAHRGGIGMMASCLRLAVPQLIMGQVMDHPDNGSRVEKLDAGRWCLTFAADARRLKSLMGDVARDPRYKQGAQAASARIDPAATVSQAVETLENVAR